jgi:septal ring factor EnvC (AmiA/AmiB activator)
MNSLYSSQIAADQVRRIRFPMPALLALGLLLAAPVYGADAPGEAQLREKLRSATRQLTDAQSELSSVKSAKESLEQEKKKLQAEIEEKNKKTAADGKKLKELKDSLTEKDKNLSDLQQKTDERIQSLEAELATEKARGQSIEEARKRVVDEKLAALNDVAERERQNIELYRIAMEVLQRYEKFGLGEALAAKEPFVGLTRTKLENIVQEYRSKLYSQRAQPKAAEAK